MDWILPLTVGVVVASMVSQWGLARRKLTVALVANAVAAAFALVCNTLLYLRHAEDYGVLVYHALSLWQLGCSFWGLFGVSAPEEGKNGRTVEVPMKIGCLLLVDDDAREAEATRRKLELARVEVGDVVVATSLAEALSVVTKNEVDVVLLDLDLGDSRSLDTLRAVRAVTDTVIIVLSQGEDELLGVEAIRLGADDFLVKGRLTAAALRSSIVYSMTRHNLHATAGRINSKLERLSRLVGV